jgi:hypothetical protein
MHLMLKKCKTHFFNGFSTKSSKILNDYNLIDVYQCHSPQKKLKKKNPLKNFIFCDRFHFVTLIIHTFKFFKVCCFQKKLINLNLKLIKYN